MFGLKSNTHYLFNLVFKENKFIFLRNCNIFITGATGFLGKWLIEVLIYLNEKHKLNITLSLLIRNKNFPLRFLSETNKSKLTNIKLILGDIRNFTFPDDKIDHIIHLASTNLIKSEMIKSNSLDIIVNGTKRIIELSRAVDSSSITYLSSGAVYGKNCPRQQGWKENDKTIDLFDNNINFYAKAKKLAENHLIKNFYNLEKLQTLNIFRSFSFGGSGFNDDNSYAFDSFIKDRIANKIIRLDSDGNSKRNYMHPIDLSNWILKGLNFKEINVLNTGINKSLKLKNLAANISTYKYNSLSKVPVELGNINKTENYIPNISKANQLGLKSYIPLELQIEDSLNFHYSRNLL